MRPEPAIVGRPSIRTVGAPSLAQGAYGARGNLELVTCDEASGLWVFWFNADHETDPLETPDVPPGSWSAGLRFAEGRRYRDAQILQSSLGADAAGRGHLEVLALREDGVLESWYWSPGPGFRRRSSEAAVGVDAFVAVHHAGSVRVSTRSAAGAVSHWVSTPAGYPERAWAAAADGPSLDVDAADVVAAAGSEPDDIRPGTARRAVSTRAGGTAELTWRDTGGRIHHLGRPA